MRFRSLFAVAALVGVSLTGAFSSPSNFAEAKALKAGVAVSSIKKGGKPVTRAQLNASPIFKEAMGYFQKKNYADALKDLQILDSTGYCSDNVHYYIAQCYQNTNQTVAAGQHYGWVLEKSKDPTLRRYADYATQCLAYYSGHRTYGGQGNNFARYSSGGFSGGGGGGGRVSFG